MFGALGNLLFAWSSGLMLPAIQVRGGGGLGNLLFAWSSGLMLPGRGGWIDTPGGARGLGVD